MALRATPTIAICLTAGVAAGIALARPADQNDPAVAAPVAEATASAETSVPDNDSPYLADGTPVVSGAGVDGTPAPEPAAAPVSVSIEGFAFAPSDIAAPGGSPVAVTNLDSAAHTLTARDGEFDTGTLDQNQLVSLAAPTAPGTYEFFCAIHPSMTGALVVS